MTHREAALFQKVLTLTCCIGNDKNKKLLTSIKQRTNSFIFHRSQQTHIDYNQYHLPYSIANVDLLILIRALAVFLKLRLPSAKTS